MTDRSSVIFGNKMPDKVYKKAVKSKKKYMKKFGDDSKKNYEVAVEKNRYIGDSMGFIIFWLEIRQRMYIMMSMHMRKKVHLTQKKGSLSEISVWDSDTTAFRWRWRLRRRRWVIRLTGWT